MSRRPLPLLLLPLVLAGCPSEATWEEAFDASTEGALSGVWGSGPDDVWIVGGWMDEAQIFHFDGGDWSEAEAPDVPLLAWVVGWGPDSALSVGVDGAAASWDGNAWTALDTGVDGDLWGVWGASPDDVWIVGGDAGDPASDPILLHYDGDTFTDVGLDPEQNTRDASALFKVFGVGGRVWAVGQGGLLVEKQGDDWVAVGAGAEANQDFVSLWGPSADTVVAVGGRGNARLSTWDGATWSTIAPEGVGGLNAVFMEDASRAIVGGISGYVGAFDPATGELEPEAVLGTGDVHAIWGDGEGTHYAVGGRFSEPLSGLAAVRTE